MAFMPNRLFDFKMILSSDRDGFIHLFAANNLKSYLILKTVKTLISALDMNKDGSYPTTKFQDAITFERYQRFYFFRYFFQAVIICAAD